MKPDWSKHEVAGLAWDAIRDRLGAGAVAILPIGAGAKQHGFHMPVGTDQVFADYFARALATEIDALIWPTLTTEPIRLSSAMREAPACPMRASTLSSPRLPTRSSHLVPGAFSSSTPD